MVPNGLQIFPQMSSPVPGLLAVCCLELYCNLVAHLTLTWTAKSLKGLFVMKLPCTIWKEAETNVVKKMQSWTNIYIFNTGMDQYWDVIPCFFRAISEALKFKDPDLVQIKAPYDYLCTIWG